MEFFSATVQLHAMKKLVGKMIDPEAHPEKVAARVYAMRESMKMSKAGFADSVGLDRSSLTKIEKGAAGLDIAVAARIAVLYGFGLDFIYLGDMQDCPVPLRAEILSLMFRYRQTGGKVQG